MREKQLLVTGSVAKDPQRSICHDLRDVKADIFSILSHCLKTISYSEPLK